MFVVNTLVSKAVALRKKKNYAWLFETVDLSA